MAAGLLVGQVVEEAQGLQSLVHRGLDVFFHGAGGVVAKAGVDVVINHC
jgi:hypothetical protein